MTDNKYTPPDYAGIFAEARANAETNGGAKYAFPQIALDALEGRLGEICKNHMSDLPISYAWPALLAVASSLIEERTTRTNLYVALVGPVHSGKTQAIERAIHLLNCDEPTLMTTLVGSGEQLVRRTKDAEGAARLLSPDELQHLFDKGKIENSSLPAILNISYYKDKIENLMARKERVVSHCVLSVVGGIVRNKFERVFNSASTAGLYDRFTFGMTQDESAYEYMPYNGPNFHIKTTRVVVAREVYQQLTNYRKANNWNARIVENALRSAVVCASFDGRTSLTAEDLGPAYSFASYQTMIRNYLKPNSGENVEGILTHKFLNYLDQMPEGASISERDLFRNTNAYDYGSNACKRVVFALEDNEEVYRFKMGKEQRIRRKTDADRLQETQGENK